MEVQELIKLNSREVRGSSSLMAIYVELFQKHFGYKPNCAGCTFNSDFQKLKNTVLNQSSNKNLNNQIMEKTFQLRQVKGEILTYKKDGKTVRQYDNRMTEDFAISFLTNGTKEQIEDRKKLFKKIPKGLVKEVTEAKAETVSETKPKAKRTKKVDNE